jgi:hypothetical protein
MQVFSKVVYLNFTSILVTNSAWGVQRFPQAMHFSQDYMVYVNSYWILKLTREFKYKTHRWDSQASLEGYWGQHSSVLYRWQLGKFISEAL